MADNTSEVEINNETDFELVLLFKLKEHLFCLDLSFVKKVIYITETQFIPGAPGYFTGLLNLHGASIPIVDLAAKLEIKREASLTLKTPVILCENGEKHVGLIVDEVLGVESVPKTLIKTQDFIKGDMATYLQGNINTPKGDALLLSLQKLALDM